jgi:hypothetical protein
MNPIGLGADALRVLATVTIPGAMALFPWFWLLVATQPALRAFCKDNGQAVGTCLVFSIVLVGYLCQTVCSYIEGRLFDNIIATERGDDNHLLHWYSYLNDPTTRECIMVKYISQCVHKMKFELAIAVALIPAWIGSMLIVEWYDGPCSVHIFLALVCLTGVWALLKTSLSLARVLSNLRESLYQRTSRTWREVNDIPLSERS